MKFTAKIFTIILAMTMLGSMCLISAVEAEVPDEVCFECMGDSSAIVDSVEVVSHSGEAHIKTVTTVYICSHNKRCMEAEYTTYDPDYHVYENWGCTGYDYHIASRHYYELEGSCECGATDTKIESVICTGDGTTCPNPFNNVEDEPVVS